MCDFAEEKTDAGTFCYVPVGHKSALTTLKTATSKRTASFYILLWNVSKKQMYTNISARNFILFYFKLIRIDTTFDLSQKAKKRW